MNRSFGRSERAFDAAVWTVLIATVLVTVVPLWYVVVISVTPFEIWARTRGTFFIPFDQLTLEGYRQLLGAGRLPRAFGVSVFITLFGTFCNLVVTALMAYPLSRRDFRPRNLLLLFVLITLLFNGGLVPTYLVVRNLGLLDSYWALILPNLVSVFNLLVMKAFFEGLPAEIQDAARIDGASDLRLLTDIVLPLSRPIMATIGLFYGVGHWNAFFDAVLYISSPDKLPLQVVLRDILAAGNLNEFVGVEASESVPTQALRMAAVVITVIPLLVVYPFLQRHFTKGVLLGSIKG